MNESVSQALSSCFYPTVGPVQVDLKLNFMQPYTCALWPSFEARRSFLSKEFVHLFGDVWADVTFVFPLADFSLVGGSCNTSETLHLTFPLCMTQPAAACRSYWWNRYSTTITSTQTFYFFPPPIAYRVEKSLHPCLVIWYDITVGQWPMLALNWDVLVSSAPACVRPLKWQTALYVHAESTTDICSLRGCKC